MFSGNIPPAEGGGQGALGGPQNYTNVMNYTDKLTNASKCTKLNINFQNFLGGIAPAEGLEAPKIAQIS